MLNFLDADRIKVTIPPTRHDVLHPVDIYEDVSEKSLLISIDFDSIAIGDLDSTASVVCT